MNSGGTPPPGFDVLLNMTGAQLDNALSQVSGQPGASTAQAGFAATGQFCINGVFDGAFGDGPGGRAAALPGLRKDGDEGECLRCQAQGHARSENRCLCRGDAARSRAGAFDARWNAGGLRSTAASSRVNGDTAAGTNHHDQPYLRHRGRRQLSFHAGLRQAGFALGGAGSSFDVANGFGGGKADVFNAAILYAKHKIGLRAPTSPVCSAILWQDTTTDRTVTIAGTDQLRANFKGTGAGRAARGWLALRHADGWDHALRGVADDDVLSARLRRNRDLGQQHLRAELCVEDRDRDT